MPALGRPGRRTGWMSGGSSSQVEATAGLALSFIEQALGALALAGQSAGLVGGMGVVGRVIQPFPIVEERGELGLGYNARGVVFIPGAQVAPAVGAQVHGFVVQEVAHRTYADAQVIVGGHRSRRTSEFRGVQENEPARTAPSTVTSDVASDG